MAIPFILTDEMLLEAGEQYAHANPDKAYGVHDASILTHNALLQQSIRSSAITAFTISCTLAKICNVDQYRNARQPYKSFNNYAKLLRVHPKTIAYGVLYAKSIDFNQDTFLKEFEATPSRTFWAFARDKYVVNKPVKKADAKLLRSYTNNALRSYTLDPTNIYLENALKQIQARILTAVFPSQETHDVYAYKYAPCFLSGEPPSPNGNIVCINTDTEFFPKWSFSPASAESLHIPIPELQDDNTYPDVLISFKSLLLSKEQEDNINYMTAQFYYRLSQQYYQDMITIRNQL
jgi:hypothetical protein